MRKYAKLFESANMYYIKMDKILYNEYLKMYSDSELQIMLFGKNYTDNQISNWIDKQLLDGNAYIFSLIEKESDEYVGNAEIIKKDNDIGEIMISITPEKQNNHYGTEGMESLIQYAIDHLGLKDIELYVKKDNKKAIHCYEKIGFIVDSDGITNNDVHMTKVK